MINQQWRDAKRILLVRLDNLGDVLLTTPAFHAVKESLPGSQITLLTSPVGAQVGRLNPDIDEVIEYEAPWVDPWQEIPHDSQAQQRMIESIHERKFDGAIIFTSFRQSSLPAAMLCYLADIPLRLAASIDAPGSLLTTRHKHPEQLMHEVERGLDLVGAVGMRTDETGLVLTVPEQARAEIDNKLNQWSINASQPLVVIHPGCSMPARTYPWEMYAEVADRMIAQFNAEVIFTGTDSERELVERIRERMQGRALSVAGNLVFAETCALIERADLTITNNTGPMHISAAVQTPVVALFALTNPPEQWAPWQVLHRQLYVDVPCRICYQRVCPFGHECLRLVSPDMVADAAGGLLSGISTDAKQIVMRDGVAG